MIMIDTSAWVEFLRDTGSPTAIAVEDMLDGAIAVSDPIRMELLAGAKNDVHLEELRRLLSRYTHVSAVSGDFEYASMLYRQCRQQGITVRKLTDCLIAATAIRIDAPLLHLDSDFDGLDKCTQLNATNRF